MIKIKISNSEGIGIYMLTCALWQNNNFEQPKLIKTTLIHSDIFYENFLTNTET